MSRSRKGCSARERPEPADPLRVVSDRELGLDVLLQRREAKLLEPADLRLRERLVGDVGERAAAPLVERHGEFANGLDERLRRRPDAAPARHPFEAREVQRVLGDLEPVSPGNGLDQSLPSPSARRSRPTCICRLFVASRGGVPCHRSSMSRSARSG